MWLRRPLEKPCFDWGSKKDLGSKSSISRDMLLGLAWYAWHNERLDISEQVIKYALKHFGFMGKAINYKELWARCQIMPALFATFCWISYRLGGPSRAWARWIPADLGAQVNDYQAHLQVLHILLRKELYQGERTITATESTTLARQAARQPKNPLFLHAIDRDLDVLDILRDEQFWASERLPRRGDRKTQWIQMRDEGPDWEPELKSIDITPHSGCDFLFMYWLICRKYQIKR